MTSRQLRKRLYQELEKNVSLRVEDTDSTDIFKVSGRGELHLSILIETMRREGFEFQVSKPEVIYKTINEETYEPYEDLLIDVPEECAGGCIEKLAGRKGEMLEMQAVGSRSKMRFLIPSRGLIGFRGEFIRMTRGEGIMNHTFAEYKPYAGDINRQRMGSLIAHEEGEAVLCYSKNQSVQRHDCRRMQQSSRYCSKRLQNKKTYQYENSNSRCYGYPSGAQKYVFRGMS